MFAAYGFIAPVRRSTGLAGSAETDCHAYPKAGWALRTVVVCGLLAIALPGISSAQSIGTMQVTARVVPGSAAWSGVIEAGIAARAAVRASSERPQVRRSGLVHSATEIRAVGGRRVVFVTIQHPHN